MSNFLSLNGSNLVRLVTAPYQFLAHAIDHEQHGYRTFKCSQLNGSCVICDSGNKPKRRWLVGVVDKQTKQYKLMSFGVGLFKKIQEYAIQSGVASSGKMLKNDFQITFDFPQYNVTMLPESPLTDEELAMIPENAQEELQKLSTPPTPEEMAKQLQDLEQNTTIMCLDCGRMCNQQCQVVLHALLDELAHLVKI